MKKIDTGHDLRDIQYKSFCKISIQGKKYQALISVGQRRRMMKRVRLEKMERRGKKEGVSSF